MSDLAIALAGGAIGALIAAVFALAGRASLAWGEVGLHDREGNELNRRLTTWVDDPTLVLVREMAAISDQHVERNTYTSSIHGTDLADAKAAALHEYRDEVERVIIEMARLRSREGGWHALWRKLRRKPAPRVLATLDTEPFLERIREPVTRHGTDPVTPLDRTSRTLNDAIEDLPGLPLT